MLCSAEKLIPRYALKYVLALTHITAAINAFILNDRAISEDTDALLSFF